MVRLPGHIPLRFDPSAVPDWVEDPVQVDLSAMLRWHGGLGCTRSGLVVREGLTCAVDLGDRGTRDNPEGLTRWDDTSWLVVHDSAVRWRRLVGGQGIRADLWSLAP